MVSFSALASVALASTAAIQLSRSSAELAWKVCFWPLALMMNSEEPSLETVTSACAVVSLCYPPGSIV